MPKAVFVKIYQSKGNSDTMAVVTERVKEVIETEERRYARGKD